MGEAMNIDRERYNSLMMDDSLELAESERAAGWHFCNEFDGLLVGPGMGELSCCTCLPMDHIAKLAEIGKRWNDDSSIEKWFPISAGQIDTLKEKEAEARWLLSNVRGQRYEQNREWLERCERWLSK